jgi:Protein of unknown function (DUF1573)
MRIGKIFIFILSVILMMSCIQGTGQNKLNAAAGTKGNRTSEIVFTEYEHDFGKVKEGIKVRCAFHFMNNGIGDLVIESVTTTCGCTVPQYSKKPIPTGKDGTLDVVFNTAGKAGVNTKTITVRSNAKTPVVLLKIKAEVISDK